MLDAHIEFLGPDMQGESWGKDNAYLILNLNIKCVIEEIGY